MKFTTIAAAFALVSSAFASPYQCMTKSKAQTLINRFIGIQTHEGSDLGTAQETAEQILVENYQEISDSILSLMRQPLGGVTFSGRDSYIAGVLNAPPTTSIDTLGLFVAGCNKIVWQWRYNNVGISEYPVKGFHLFTVNRKGQITKTELEFNNIAWGQDTFQLPCDSTPTSSSSEPSGSAAPPPAASLRV